MNGFGPLAAVKSRDSKQLLDVALGKSPADIVITNANVVNVYTAEVMENYTVGIKDEWIAYVGPPSEPLISTATDRIDAAGKFLIPGFIDGHMHLAWLFSIDEFLKYAIPGGTTTIITETMEPYPVCGIDGIRDFLASLQNQPIKIFATAPAMVSISTKSRGIAVDDLTAILERDDILGIGESYWQTVLQSPDIYLPEFQQTLQKGKTLEGHSAGAHGNKLVAYAACGISSCHEPISAQEALERLRLGIYVMAREGSIRRDLKAIAEIMNKNVDLRRLIISTDGVEPEELIEKGYMEYVVQRAVHYGFNPIAAIQMATINVAEHFSIDHLVGGIAPGRYADMLLLPNLSTFSPQMVISSGRRIAQDGQSVVTPRKHTYSQRSKNSVHLSRPMTPVDFIVNAPCRQPVAQIRVINMVTDLVTQEKIMAVPVNNRQIDISIKEDLLKIAAVDRANDSDRLFTGFIQGFGLKAGALACSAAWDTSDIVVIGADESDMAFAVNRIAHLQGAAVLCRGEKIIVELPLPVFGLLSEAPMGEIAEKMKKINDDAAALGISFPDPLLTLITLTGAAIPYLRICEEGLVNLKDGENKRLFPDKPRG